MSGAGDLDGAARADRPVHPPTTGSFRRLVGTVAQRGGDAIVEGRRGADRNLLVGRCRDPSAYRRRPLGGSAKQLPRATVEELNLGNFREGLKPTLKISDRLDTARRVHRFRQVNDVGCLRGCRFDVAQL